MQNSPTMASTEQAAQTSGFSPERGDADADTSDWEGVVPTTATSYADAGEMYGEEEVGKTVVSTRVNCGFLSMCSLLPRCIYCRRFRYSVRKEACFYCLWLSTSTSFVLLAGSLDHGHRDVLATCHVFVVSCLGIPCSPKHLTNSAWLDFILQTTV